MTERKKIFELKLSVSFFISLCVKKWHHSEAAIENLVWFAKWYDRIGTAV